MHKQFIKLMVWAVFFCLLLAAPALAGTAQYTYDNLGRLIQVVYDNGATIVYTYDAAGNRIVQPGSGCGGPLSNNLSICGTGIPAVL